MRSTSFRYVLALNGFFALSPALPLSCLAAEPLSLQECLALADKNNPEIQAARNLAAAKSAGVRTSAAAFLPKVDAESSLSREDSVKRSLGSRVSSELYTPASLSVSQLLFDFGKASQAYSRSKHDLAASEYGVGTTRAQVFLAVKTAFIGLLKAQRALGIAQETLQHREKLLEVAQELFDSGVRPRFDVVRSQIDVENARLDLVEAETRLAREWPNLEVALGISDLPAKELGDVLDDTERDIDAARVQATALEHRLEIVSQREQIDGQLNTLSLARRDFLPTTEASSALAYRQSRTGGVFQGHERDWTVGVSAKLNVFGGFSGLAAIRREEANLQRAREDLRSVEQRISAEARQAYQAVAGEARKLKIARNLEALASENENLSWQLYRSGKGTIIFVTDAQNQLLSARLSRLNSLADYHLTLSRLEYAAGAGIEEFRKR